MKNRSILQHVDQNFWQVAAPIIGGMLGGGLSMWGQKSANDQNFDMNERNKSWQEHMSNTAHQREVNDLREAGLNPILSATKGASTPTPNLARAENTMAGLGSAIATSAIDAARIGNETKALGSTMALQEAQGAAAAAASNLSNASAKRQEIETELSAYQKGAVKSRAELEEKQNKIDKKYINFDNTTKRINQSLGAANSAKDLITPKFAPRINPERVLKKNEGKFNKKTGEIYE